MCLTEILFLLTCHILYPVIISYFQLVRHVCYFVILLYLLSLCLELPSYTFLTSTLNYRHAPLFLLFNLVTRIGPGFFCMQYKHFQLEQFFATGFCYVVQTAVRFTILLQASMCFSCKYLSLDPVHIHLLMNLKTYI